MILGPGFWYMIGPYGQGLYSCLYIYMHMHCCFVYTAVPSFFWMSKSSLFIPRGQVCASSQSQSFLFSTKNHKSIVHPHTMPPNASKTVFGEYPTSQTRA